jgi:hypothetical protein
MSEPLLTARQMAERLSVTPKTVLRWTRRGVIRCDQAAERAIRYRPEDADAFEREHEIGADGASREVSPTRSASRPGQAYGEGYLDSSPTKLRDAVRDEEDQDAC